MAVAHTTSKYAKILIVPHPFGTQWAPFTPASLLHSTMYYNCDLCFPQTKSRGNMHTHFTFSLLLIFGLQSDPTFLLNSSLPSSSRRNTDTHLILVSLPSSIGSSAVTTWCSESTVKQRLSSGPWFSLICYYSVKEWEESLRLMNVTIKPRAQFVLCSIDRGKDPCLG